MSPPLLGAQNYLRQYFIGFLDSLRFRYGRLSRGYHDRSNPVRHRRVLRSALMVPCSTRASACFHVGRVWSIPSVRRNYLPLLLQSPLPFYDLGPWAFDSSLGFLVFYYEDPEADAGEPDIDSTA